MSHETEILLIAAFVSTTCAVLGVFLVLRGKAMITDAVSHSILPGIAAGFLLTGSLSSPFMFAGAIAAAFISVVFSETLARGKLMTEDSAIAFVYPLLFSIGVILISRYSGGAHLDVDSVLLGEIAFAPLDRVNIIGADLPASLVSSALLAVFVWGFVAVFYKEMKLSTFDPEAAKTAGFEKRALSVPLRLVVCATCVVSFGAVGSVMLISLIAAPASCALLLTRKLGKTVFLSATVAAASSFAGFHTAAHFNTNIAGAVTSVLGTVFVLVLMFAPQNGVISRLFETRRREKNFMAALLVEHISDEGGSGSVKSVCKAMNWNMDTAVRAATQAQNRGWARTDGITVRLTGLGASAAQHRVY